MKLQPAIPLLAVWVLSACTQSNTEQARVAVRTDTPTPFATETLYREPTAQDIQNARLRWLRSDAKTIVADSLPGKSSGGDSSALQPATASR